LKPWSTFAQVAGTAAASLIGPCFSRSPSGSTSSLAHRSSESRAAQTLSLFGTVLLTAILIAIPGQATEALGAELTALAVIAGAGLFVLDRRAKADATTQAIRKTREMITATTIVSIFLLVSCVLLEMDGLASARFRSGSLELRLEGGHIQWSVGSRLCGQRGAGEKSRRRRSPSSTRKPRRSPADPSSRRPSLRQLIGSSSTSSRPRRGDSEPFGEVVLVTHSDQALPCSPTRPRHGQ
jgi:hypothetical protein